MKPDFNSVTIGVAVSVIIPASGYVASGSPRSSVAFTNTSDKTIYIAAGDQRELTVANGRPVYPGDDVAFTDDSARAAIQGLSPNGSVTIPYSIS